MIFATHLGLQLSSRELIAPYFFHVRLPTDQTSLSAIKRPRKKLYAHGRLAMSRLILE